MTDQPDALQLAIEKLISAGQAKGSVTISQVNAVLPSDIVFSARQVEQVYAALADRGIRIVDG